MCPVTETLLAAHARSSLNGHHLISVTVRAYVPVMNPSRRRTTGPIALLWRNGFPPIRQSAEQLEHPARACNVWRCPVCSASVARPHRPGRAKVYCTNACRQRAYRWRCARRSQLTTPIPPQRAQTADRTHAVRSAADFVAPLADPDGRRVTVCGAFARAASDRSESFRHTSFYVIDDDGHPPPSTCSTCVRLLSVPLRPLADILAEIDVLHPRPIAA